MEIATGKDAYAKANPDKYPSRKEVLLKAQTQANVAKVTATAPAKVAFGKTK